jgi:hypothetical protein
LLTKHIRAFTENLGDTHVERTTFHKLIGT